MTEPALSSQASQRRSRWKWFLALGAVLLVLGIGGMTVATLLELTSLLVFGPFLLASSIIQFLTAFFAEAWNERLPHLVAAGLEMVLGFLIMANPPQTIIGLIALIAIF